ncbi:MAG: DMT family transporter [Eubacteriales bacterium]
MIKNSKVADVALFITAVIWGTGFIGVEYAIETGASPALIVTMRFLIAGILLGILYCKSLKNIDKETLKVGVIAGTMLFGGFYLQTWGQSHAATVSNSSFITATNVVMVPFIVWFFTKKKPRTKYFVLGSLALIGSAILSINLSEGFVFQIGEFVILLSAVCFALHIAYLGIWGREVDSKLLTFLQMIVSGLLALLFMILFDRESMDIVLVKAALPSTVYLAVFSSCVCYYLQTTAQQHTSPSKTGIILCLEGFFGSFFAVLLGIDSLSVTLVIGGAIIISSAILSEVEFPVRKKK